MHYSFLARKSGVPAGIGRRIITLLIGALIMTAYADASDSLYLEYMQKADSMFTAGQFDSSLVMVQQARDEAVKLYGEEDTLVARALYRIGECYINLSDTSEAENQWRASLAIRKRLRGPDHSEVAECLCGLADIAYDRGQRHDAESLYVQAAAICEPLQGKERIKLARAVQGIANTIYWKGDYPQAEQLYYRALEIAGAAAGERNALYLRLMANIGLVLIRMGNNDSALTILQKAAALTEEVYGPQSPKLYSALCSIGLIYRRFMEFQKAESYFERIIKIIEDSLGMDDRQLETPLLNLGKIYRTVGNLPESERCLRRLLDIIGEGRELEAAATVTTLARVYYDQGDSAAFQQYYNRALSTYEQSLNSGYLDLPSGLMNFSNYFRYYDPVVSLEFARHGYELRRNYLLSNCLAMSEAEALRFSWYMREAASYYLSAYLDLKPQDSLFRVAASDIIFASKGQVSDEIFERNMAVYKNTSPEVLALRDSLGQAKIRLSSIYASGQYGSGRGGFDTVRDSFVTEIDRMESRLIEIGSDRTRLREPHYVTTGHIAEALPDGSVLVEYLRYSNLQRNPDTIIAHYLVTVLKPGAGKRITLDLGPADVIDNLIAEYHNHMKRVAGQGQPTPDMDREYHELAVRLFNKIWKPIDNEITGNNLLLIAPDGAFNLVSFAGLPDEQGHFLSEKIPIHYLSSGRDAIWLKDEPELGEDLLALGDPDYDATAFERKAFTQTGLSSGSNSSSETQLGVPDIQRNVRSDCLPLNESRVARLPATRNEVEQIAEVWKQYKSDSALCLLGKKASEDNLKRDAPGKRVIHIATHGYFSPANCRGETPSVSVEVGEYTGHIEESPLLQSGLFLAGSNLHGEMADSLGVDDGILTAEEVSLLDLTGVEWVVLSACESGLGEVEAGEGVYGLRRAFQMAGARIVISSLWPVADRSTAEFMISLYKASDQALYEKIHRYQKAQIEKLRKHGYSDHPYQWAAFIATGDWH